MIANDKTIKILAPAKVNLFLAVGAKSSGKNSEFAADFANVPAGYHPVLNIMHTVLLHDVLYVTCAPSSTLKLSAKFIESANDDAPVQIPNISEKENLVYKAFEQVSKLSAHTNLDVGVLVEKNIPYQAGLGGGSADAAAAIVGACEVFNVNVEDPEVLKIACKLGADVPFFLNGGCALMIGDGSELCQKLQPINREIIIVRPQNSDCGLSTSEVYAQFDKMPEVVADLSGKDITIELPEHGHDDCDCVHDHSVKANMVQATKELTCADQIPLTNNLA